MLDRWLDELPLKEFLDTHYQKGPFARPDAGRAFAALAGWDLLGSIVSQRPAPAMMVVRDGRLLRGAEPGARADVDALFAAGCSVVVRRAERHDAALAAGFAADLRGQASVQLYATPAGHHSFGWHYDAEEVFVLQTIGEKEYYLRRNTVNPRPRPYALPRDMHYERETSPLMAAKLLAGDWLYIPASYWHKALARQRSLSISIGVFPS